jgi:hypothetical protein
MLDNDTDYAPTMHEFNKMIDMEKDIIIDLLS